MVPAGITTEFGHIGNKPEHLTAEVGRPAGDITVCERNTDCSKDLMILKRKEDSPVFMDAVLLGITPHGHGTCNALLLIFTYVSE